jgi:hypothetical protein
MERWPFLRDVLLFFAGLAGIAHQTLIAPQPSESLLVLFAAMCGLPAFLRQDERRNGNGKR